MAGTEHGSRLGTHAVRAAGHDERREITGLSEVRGLHLERIMRGLPLLICCVAALGCGRAISADPSPARPARNGLEVDEPRAIAEMGASAPSLPVDADPNDALSRAPFVTVAALCDLQKAAIVPKLREAERELHERGEPRILTPKCDENPAAMKSVKLALGAPFYDATAITFEDGYGTETDLVVRTPDGWARAPVVLSYDGYMDPGCPSIVRGRGLVEVRVERGPSGKPLLVVTTEADRGWEQEMSYGAMIFTQARTCRLTGLKLGCSGAETVVARIEMTDMTTRKALPAKEVFRTKYTADDKGVHPARRFDLADL